MEYLVGKYFYRLYKNTNTGDQHRFYKVVGTAIEESKPRLLIVDITRQRIIKVPLDSVGEWNICVTVPKNGVDFVCFGETSVFIKDHYLHRVGGPAYSVNKEKHYYLFGKELSKEDYLDAMPEDIQTEMCFEINEM